jgi:hypothetical protein
MQFIGFCFAMKRFAKLEGINQTLCFADRAS